MLRAVIVAAAVGWFSPVSLAAESADALQEQAVRANPSLDALRAKARLLRARSSSAGAWPDPVLAVEYSNVPTTSFGLGDHPMSGLQLKLQQTLRAPGTGRGAKDVAALQADAQDMELAAAELELRAAVAQTWWQLAQTRLLRGVTTANLERTEELLSAARSRYETGALGHHAVLRLEVLRDTLTDQLGDFDRSDRELVAGLDRALGEPGTYPTPASVDAVPPPDDFDAIALAMAHHPVLKRLGIEEVTADRRAALAKADTVPDLTVWAGYRVRTIQTPTDPGTDLVAVGASVPIPAGSARRGASEREAALEEGQAARASVQAALDTVTYQTERALARWQRAHAKVATYDQTLIPGARAALQTTQADFSVGRADFASLFEAEVALLDLERGRIAAVVETHLQRASLIATLGVEPGVSP